MQHSYTCSVSTVSSISIPGAYTAQYFARLFAASDQLVPHLLISPLLEEDPATTAQCEFRESMTSEDLSDWPLEQVISNKYCKLFERKKHLLLFIYLCLFSKTALFIGNYVEEVKEIVPRWNWPRRCLD